jgi:hypothetical protein
MLHFAVVSTIYSTGSARTRAGGGADTPTTTWLGSRFACAGEFAYYCTVRRPTGIDKETMQQRIRALNDAPVRPGALCSLLVPDEPPRGLQPRPRRRHPEGQRTQTARAVLRRPDLRLSRGQRPDAHLHPRRRPGNRPPARPPRHRLLLPPAPPPLRPRRHPLPPRRPRRPARHRRLPHFHRRATTPPFPPKSASPISSWIPVASSR